MQLLKRYGMSLLLVIFLHLSAFAAQERVEGPWTGGFELGHQWVAIAAAFQAGVGTITPTFYLVSLGGIKEIPVSAFSLKAGHLHFELVKDAEKLVLGFDYGDLLS